MRRMDTRTSNTCTTSLPWNLLLLCAMLLLGSRSAKAVSAQTTGSPKNYTAFGLFVFNTNRPYVGMTAEVSIASPKVVRPGDYSTGSIALVSSDPNNVLKFSALMNVGFIVYPARYGNSTPRFFIEYRNTAPDGKVMGCFDLDCPGFVKTYAQTNIIGSMLNNQGLGIQRRTRRIEISIQQDIKTKNWVVSYEKLKLGYWPNSLFTGATFNKAAVGGAVFDSTGDTTPASQMGSGIPPGDNLLRNQGQGVAYATNIQLVDDQGIGSSVIHQVNTNPGCYALNSFPNSPALANSTFFFYGGQGCLV